MSEKRYWVFYDILSKVQSNSIPTEDAQLAIYKMRPVDLERFFIWTDGWKNWQPLKAYLDTNQKYFTMTAPNHSDFFAGLNEKTLKVTERQVHPKPAASSDTEKKSAKEKTITKSFSMIRLDDGQPTDSPDQANLQDFDPDNLNIKHTQKPDIDFSKLNSKKSLKTRATRHDFKIEILLIAPKGQTFRSHSRNISLSGALLEESIPAEFYKTSFDIVIINHISQNTQLSRLTVRGKVVGEGLTQRIQYLELSSAHKENLIKLLSHYKDIKEASIKKAS